MRLLHTADWHLGRRLKGVDRTPELSAALDELLASAIRLEADAVLVAGDVFDVPTPPAEAERLAWRFFHGLGAAGIPAVLVAGNHDSAARFDGLAGLLGLAGVSALGRPRLAAAGGVVELQTRSGKLRVGALPFASERRLLTADDLWEKDDTEQRAKYRDMVAKIMRNLASGFGDDTVNVMMAHVALDGAQISHSEAPFYTTGAYCIGEDSLPAEAQYMALGHIHKPQRVACATPTYYSGSLIQVDFGEAEEAKGFNVIDVEPGRPAKVEFHELTVAKALKVITCSGDGLEAALEAHRDHPGYLKVVVDLEGPVVGLGDRVRKICPQTVMIEPRYPQAKATDGAQGHLLERMDPSSAYVQYYQDRLGLAPQAAVAAAFTRLYEELTHETA